MIKEGTNVVIVDNSGNQRVLKVKGGGGKKKPIKHFKVMLDIAQLIGTDFGVHYHVRDPKTGDLEVIQDVKVLTRAFLDQEEENDGAGDA
jgi:hypothetical protein